jgi:hypothetical protein
MTQAEKKSSIKQITLPTLPTEIHLHIFSRRDKCTSAYLGLTCKRFCPIYREVNRITSMLHQTMPSRDNKKIYLLQLLKEWMGDSLTMRRLEILEGGYQENGA